MTMWRSVRIDGNYEVVRAACPACGALNVFNRRSDFNDLSPIAHRTVNCLVTSCGRSYDICGDSIGPSYRMFYFDTYEFMEAKRYSLVVLAGAQCLEMFFSHAIRELWLLKRFMRDRHTPDSLEELNDALGVFYKKTKSMAYRELRDLFLYAVLTKRPTSVAEGRLLIEKVKKRPAPTDADLDSVPAPLRALALNDCRVHELRNKIVHQHAYRPSREEAEDAIKQVGDILIPLASKLRVEFDNF